MELVDTHAHLDEDSFQPDWNDVLARASDASVVAIVTIGTTLASSRQSIALAEKHPELFAAVGIHPNYVSQAAPGDWEEIEELAAHPRVVAVGETGLDRYWNVAPLELQSDFFGRHIALSRSTGKPFIVHCRDAEEEVTAFLERSAADGPLHGVLHSFCGSRNSAERGLALGLSLSFSGMLTYRKNAPLRELAGWAPADRVLVETDAPYLPPAPNRGKRNEPAWVRHTAECLAESRGLSLEQAAEQTTTNARRLFGLSSPIV